MAKDEKKEVGTLHKAEEKSFETSDHKKKVGVQEYSEPKKK